jgi:hypothetical protein
VKLSATQLRALGVLFNELDNFSGGWMSYGQFGCRTNTLDSLVDLGLIERRFNSALRAGLGSPYEARLGPKGMAVWKASA